MWLARFAVIAAALVTALSGCAPYAQTSIDPEQATERAVTGAVLGAALGTGIGVTSAINPALGAVIGVESGAAVGAAIGVMTTPPIPEYKPIPVPAEAVIPDFYDNWPPGYYRPPGNPETVLPPSG
jgi:ABC-type enterobactin transport system permease subunit